MYVSLLLFSPSSIPDCCYSRVIQSSAPLHSAPLDPLAPLNSSSPESESDFESESVAVSAALLFDPSKSIPDCSHRRRDTLAPGRQVDRSQRSRIGHVAIYYVTIFCLLVTDLLIPSKPVSPIASYNGG